MKRGSVEKNVLIGDTGLVNEPSTSRSIISFRESIQLQSYLRAVRILDPFRWSF
jgi:hypothetical protein